MKTYCTMIISLIRVSLKRQFNFTGTAYTADGIDMEMTDRVTDQKYKIKVIAI